MLYRGFGDPRKRDDYYHIENEYSAGVWEHGITYTTAPGTSWEWPRCHAVGGKTNFWGRSAARMGDIDFRTASVDGGYDVDWPVTYDEIAPYYSRVERTIGVASTVQGRPSNPDGEYLPPMPLRCLDHILKSGCDKTTPTAWPSSPCPTRVIRPAITAATARRAVTPDRSFRRRGSCCPRRRRRASWSCARTPWCEASSPATTDGQKAWPTSIATRSKRSRSTQRRS
jgi:choline dehydrogenase-like flavoprotein